MKARIQSSLRYSCSSPMLHYQFVPSLANCWRSTGKSLRPYYGASWSSENSWRCSGNILQTHSGRKIFKQLVSFKTVSTFPKPKTNWYRHFLFFIIKKFRTCGTCQSRCYICKESATSRGCYLSLKESKAKWNTNINLLDYQTIISYSETCHKPASLVRYAYLIILCYLWI